MLKRNVLLLGCILAFTGINAKTPLVLSKAPQAEMNAWVDSVYNSMTAEQRVGQLIAQVFRTSDSEMAATKKEIKRVVDRYHIGWAYFSDGPAEIMPSWPITSMKFPICLCLSGSTASGACR